jgi:tartrate dehydrogenase/decarboxylase/D-malate dehydrogenase
MLEHLGHRDAADAIVQAIERVVREGPKTRDMGGNANTTDVGKAIAGAL